MPVPQQTSKSGIEARDSDEEGEEESLSDKSQELIVAIKSSAPFALAWKNASME